MEGNFTEEELNYMLTLKYEDLEKMMFPFSTNHGEGHAKINYVEIGMKSTLGIMFQTNPNRSLIFGLSTFHNIFIVEEAIARNVARHTWDELQKIKMKKERELEKQIRENCYFRPGEYLNHTKEEELKAMVYPYSEDPSLAIVYGSTPLGRILYNEKNQPLIKGILIEKSTAICAIKIISETLKTVETI